MSERQIQRAGDGSQQIQVAGNYVVIQGITEERAAEIAEAKVEEALAELSHEGYAIGEERARRLDEMIVRSAAQMETLDAFADPAFQVLLRKAQIKAACTGGEDELALLTKLLTEKAGNPARRIHAPLSRAIDVIDEIDSEDLSALSALWVILRLKWNVRDFRDGLRSMDQLLATVMQDFPSDYTCISRLDITSCIRVSSLGSIRPWQDVYPDKLPGSFSQGIPENQKAETERKIREVSTALQGLFYRDPINHNEYRLATTKAVDKWVEQQTFLTPEQSRALLELLSSVGLTQRDPSRVAFMDQYITDNCPALARARDWWNGLPNAVEITSTGIALAYTNLKRFVPLNGLGPLETILY
ncbi:LPO_1073/Vpar_1526 family protein [Microbispora bryophytorum]|uniref:LPO_1073/Vpar_1526 family protein n=1 Tax=Microbispora bryophytorum TaxID=1460882 RepID=UPI0033FC18F4